MSLFYPSDQYQQSKQLIYASIANFVIDLANIVNDYCIVELRVGTKVDCKDCLGMWCIAQVMRVAEEEGQAKFYIHYCGWQTQYDEWIDMQAVCWRLDLLNQHTPLDEDLIISSDFITNELSSVPFYQKRPTVSQRQGLVRRISERGFPADAVYREYKRFQWNQSPFAIFRELWLKDCPIERSVCRCTRENMCEFCRDKLRELG